jgi:hypothetical protein
VKRLWIALCLVAHAGAALAAEPPVAKGGLCGGAIEAAQQRHAVPPGLLFAIGQVESGRPDRLSHRIVPWPWTVQAQNQSYYFASKAEAVTWVQAAQARGILSIDVGCMQVNLMYHPAAFETLDAAFEPDTNADYAARFLVSLHAQTGDWQKAAGLYHSQTLALAIPYAQRVEEALTGKLPPEAAPASPQLTKLAMLQAAWGATLDRAAPAPAPAPVAAAPLWTWSGLAALHPRTHFPRAHLRPAPVLLSYEH